MVRNASPRHDPHEPYILHPPAAEKMNSGLNKNHDLFDVLEDHFFGKVWRSLVTFLCCRGKRFLRLGVRFEPCLTPTHQTGNVHNEAGKCPQKWWRETKKVQTGQLGWVWPAIQPSDLYSGPKKYKKKTPSPTSLLKPPFQHPGLPRSFPGKGSAVFFPFHPAETIPSLIWRRFWVPVGVTKAVSTP